MAANDPPGLPRAILFDWDNTLVDTWPVIHDSMNVTLTHMGWEPWTMDETRARVRRPRPRPRGAGAATGR